MPCEAELSHLHRDPGQPGHHVFQIVGVRRLLRFAPVAFVIGAAL
jgi:hypothetical protein